MPRVRRHSWQSSIDIRYLNNPVTCLGIDQVGPWNTQPLSRHILLYTSQIMFTVFPVYIPTPILLLGCNTRLHGVPSAWVFVSGMLAEAKAKSFVPQNPLILRDHVPSSFVRMLPPVLRPECLRFSRSAYLRFLLRPELPPVQGPRAFGFRGPSTSA